MIIQAGFDLEILVRPLVVQEGRVLPKLVVVALDAEMQLDCIKVVSDEFAGYLQPHQEAILGWMDLEWTKYFAIAHAVIWPEDVGCIQGMENAVENWAANWPRKID